ncbi:putative conserved oligomeric Golgi complex subunit 8-like [Apostichopus japonicus]|uniref:Conserved oligomeric Golgi complex subunit 8 n=1 Tax=Stichopus japonicus TaxID=307972 RepID=A0A2G8JFK6_STIJA|nr:putative conserved oligomeric Golgi complex subunit 8-like [Apostichopus japonicus]
MDHVPLASYTNGILAAFNDLRLCAPLALVEDVTRTLTESLLTIVQTTVSYHRAEESTFSSREGEQFQGFCETIANQLVPYMGRCLQALFPQSVIAQTMGLTVAELQKWGTVGILNISNIISEMDHLLPKKDSEIADTASETRNKRDDLSQIPEEDEEEEEKDSTKEADMEERVSGQRVNFEVGDEDGDNPERESVRELSKIDEEEEDRSAETEQEKGNGIDQGTVSSTAEGEPGGGDGGLLEGDEGEGEGKGGEEGQEWSQSGWDDFPVEEETEGDNIPGLNKGKGGKGD